MLLYGITHICFNIHTSKWHFDKSLDVDLLLSAVTVFEDHLWLIVWQHVLHNIGTVPPNLGLKSNNLAKHIISLLITTHLVWFKINFHSRAKVLTHLLFAKYNQFQSGNNLHFRNAITYFKINSFWTPNKIRRGKIQTWNKRII